MPDSCSSAKVQAKKPIPSPRDYYHPNDRNTGARWGAPVLCMYRSFSVTFAVRIHVEIIVASLPKALARCCLPELTLGARPPLAQQAPGDALLEDLHQDGNGASLWLADQDMNVTTPGVLRHDDESDYVKAVALAHLLEDFEKYVARTRPPQ